MMMTEQFTTEQADMLTGAGFTLTGPAWMPSRNDQFKRVNANGVSVSITTETTPRGTEGWRVGLTYFVDNSYGEYCDFFPGLADAIEHATAKLGA